jgi:hypothetical protein
LFLSYNQSSIPINSLHLLSASFLLSNHWSMLGIRFGLWNSTTYFVVIIRSSPKGFLQYCVVVYNFINVCHTWFGRCNNLITLYKCSLYLSTKCLYDSWSLWWSKLNVPIGYSRIICWWDWISHRLRIPRNRVLRVQSIYTLDEGHIYPVNLNRLQFVWTLPDLPLIILLIEI